MPVKSSAESVSAVERHAGRVLNPIPAISGGKGKKRALSRSEVIPDTVHDSNIAGPSTLPIKKGAFPTLHLHDCLTILV
jgi:hypothetical protein